MATTFGNEKFARFNIPEQTSVAYYSMQYAIHTLQLFIKAAFRKFSVQLIKARAIFFLVHTKPKFSQFVKKKCKLLELENFFDNIDAYKSLVKLQINYKTQ